jgi:UDP-N-acetylglucosamine acyltransferase
MAGAHLGHNVRLGHHVILANNVLVAGHVHFGDRVFVGGGAVFHQHIRVGSHVICQGMSGFSKDIPPYTIGAEINYVAGLNVVGLRRGGFDVAQRAEIKAAIELLYRSGRNVSQALAAAEEQTWSDVGRLFWSFVAAAKKKGICALLSAGKRGGDDPAG